MNFRIIESTAQSHTIENITLYKDLLEKIWSLTCIPPSYQILIVRGNPPLDTDIPESLYSSKLAKEMGLSDGDVIHLLKASEKIPNTFLKFAIRKKRKDLVKKIIEEMEEALPSNVIVQFNFSVIEDMTEIFFGVGIDPDYQEIGYCTIQAFPPFIPAEEMFCIAGGDLNILIGKNGISSILEAPVLKDEPSPIFIEGGGEVKEGWKKRAKRNWGMGSEKWNSVFESIGIPE